MRAAAKTTIALTVPVCSATANPRPTARTIPNHATGAGIPTIDAGGAARTTATRPRHAAQPRTVSEMGPTNGRRPPGAVVCDDNLRLRDSSLPRRGLAEPRTPDSGAGPAHYRGNAFAHRQRALTRSNLHPSLTRPRVGRNNA